MQDMTNVQFQRGWFGPFSIPNVYRGVADVAKHVGPVYDDGPLDGLKTTSIWAQRMAQIPLRSFAQNPMLGSPGHSSLAMRGMGAPVFCLPGHIPVPTGVPGQSKCVPYSPPSGMIGPQGATRTFPVSPGYGWKAMGSGLGQAQDPYLTKPQRDKLLFEYNTSIGYLKPIEDLFAWSGDYQNGMRLVLGSDASRFSALMNSISPLYTTVKPVGDRLADNDAESWYQLNDYETAAMQQWLVGMTEMYKILVAHRSLPVTLAPGMKIPPGFTATTPAPATQTVRQPGSSTTGSTGNIPTKELLLGGGLAVGLGLLIYAIVA